MIVHSGPSAAPIAQAHRARHEHRRLRVVRVAHLALAGAAGAQVGQQTIRGAVEPATAINDMRRYRSSRTHADLPTSQPQRGVGQPLSVVGLLGMEVVMKSDASFFGDVGGEGDVAVADGAAGDLAAVVQLADPVALCEAESVSSSRVFLISAPV